MSVLLLPGTAARDPRRTCQPISLPKRGHEFLDAALDVDESVAAGLIESLAESAPEYHVPPAAFAHTRHYMPQGQPAKTSLVIDAFADVRDGVVHVLWSELDLSEGELSLFVELLRRLSYVGRAESWVRAEIEPNPPTPNVRVGSMRTCGNGVEPVRLLAPLPAALTADWAGAARRDLGESLLAGRRAADSARGKDPTKTKLTKADSAKLDAIPDTLWRVLSADTTTLQKAGWSDPPGSRWVDYVSEPEVARRRVAQEAAPRPTVARFAIASAVLPHVTDVVSVADRVHKALVARAATPVFTGSDEHGSALAGHEHAFILPEPGAKRADRIKYITVAARMGFGPDEVRAFESMRRLWGRDGHDLQVVFLGTGGADDFGGVNVDDGESPTFAIASVWRSLTPFVATRHMKRGGGGVPKLDSHGDAIGSPKHDLIRLLGELGFGRPLRVDPVERASVAGKSMAWSRWKLDRPTGGGRKAVAFGTGFEIEFPEPVRGPIAVGYGAHFGLGVFVPVDARRSS